MANRIEVDLPSGFSDGTSSMWPQGTEYVQAPEDLLYLIKLADLGKGLIDGSTDGKFCFIYFNLLISCRANAPFCKLCPLRCSLSAFSVYGMTTIPHLKAPIHWHVSESFSTRVPVTTNEIHRITYFSIILPFPDPCTPSLHGLLTR